MAIAFALAALAAAVLSAATAADSGCWRRHSGVCVQYHDNGCPFTGGWFTWTGCSQGHYCCVPPRPEPRQRTPQGPCGRRGPGAGQRSPPFIHGGSASVEGDWPWLVQLRLDGRHHCGGVLIGQRWVLTAGHCVAFLQPQTTLTLHAGHVSRDSRQQQSLGAARVVVHEKFFQPLYKNDIALVQLNESLRLGELVSPICLPEAGEAFGNTAGAVAGWGLTENNTLPGHLREVQLPTVPLAECRRLYREVGRPIFDQNLCAGFRLGGRDSCGGDSGGPLMFARDGQWIVGGIVSHGTECHDTIPGVYAGVSSFVAWIRGHVTTG